MKKSILFVCLGNICRSPAAEGIMKEIVKKAGLKHEFFIDSAGTSAWHEGELPDMRMRSHAGKRDYKLQSRSRPVRIADFEEFDIILAMDDTNLRNLKSMAPDLESENKIYRMTDFCKKITVDHVPDPYYGGISGFERVLDILEDACAGLLEDIQNNKLF